MGNFLSLFCVLSTGVLLLREGEKVEVLKYDEPLPWWLRW